MENQKVHFTLSESAIAVINQRAPSPNKRGEWISNAILDYDKILTGVTSGDDDKGLLEQVVTRLGHIEKQLSALLSKSSLANG